MSSSNEPITADQDKNRLLSGLPPAETRRWSSRRKAAIVIAIRAGVLNRQGAYELYTLSLEELALSKSSPLGRPRSIKTASRACASRVYRFTATPRLENAEAPLNSRLLGRPIDLDRWPAFIAPRRPA